MQYTEVDMLNIRKVAVGISGGVDSAVAALLLKKKEFDVFGLFMQNWDIRDEKGVCSSEEDYKDAVLICNKLDIKLYHVNFVKEYWNDVFCHLIKDYEAGLTPNPDILCNKHIKFNYFVDYAINKLKADAIATGHYAGSNFGLYLERYSSRSKAKLLLPKDTKKDQTFFLSQISQEALQRTMFPLGDLTKLEVKQIAAQNGLEKIASKQESMGICFIGSRNFQDFIKEYISEKPGDFVDIDTGKVMGQHNGIHQWTLGQRSKLSGRPKALFIAQKNVEKNIIYVAEGTDHPRLFTDLFSTSKPHWIHSQPQELKDGYVLECKFKFQHVDLWDSCEICETQDGLVVRLSDYKRAITPGQYAVFAKDDECLGSARILDTAVSKFSVEYLNNNCLDQKDVCDINKISIKA